MGRRLFVGLALAASLAAGGCGSSANTGDGGAVLRAADATAASSGYQVAGTMTIGVLGQQVGVSLTGSIDRAHRAGVLQVNESIAGGAHKLVEKFAGTKFFIQATGLPGVSRVTGGKPWLEFDVGKLLGGMGLATSPGTGSDPSQFVDYLRAVGASPTRIGASTVRGVPTTEYSAKVDLNRYIAIAPAATRAQARETITNLETAIRSHSLPMRVWVDRSRLVRRIRMSFNECVSQKHVALALSMDLFDYGQQPAVRLPSVQQAYDMTPLISAAMSGVKFGGCTAG